MKERSTSTVWFPFWADKWIFGSVRIECTLEERAIWIDLLSFASKDNGHIRANEETPYPLMQLSGMLIIPEDKLKGAIEKFIKIGKLKRDKNDTLYIVKWDKYQFSDRWKREKEKEGDSRGSSGKREHHSKKPAVYNTKENNTTQNNKTLSECEKHFTAFWESYPKHVAKKDAFKAFKALLKKEPIETIANATNGYNAYLKGERVDRGISEKEQLRYIKHPASFLRDERWQDFINFKYKARL